jgi:hypothetical protein
LENGRRLENMSWRLWYRESIIKEIATVSKEQNQQINPIPIQPTQLTTTNLTEKPLAPKSFTQIITTLHENEIMIRPPQHHHFTEIIECEPIPQKRQSKFFIKEDNESDWDESDYSDEDELFKEEINDGRLFSVTILTDTFNKPSYHAGYDEHQVIYEPNDEDNDESYETIDEDDEDDDGYCTFMIRKPYSHTYSQSNQPGACQLEFNKQIPSPIGNTKGFSLLSNMFRAQVAPDKVNLSIDNH